METNITYQNFQKMSFWEMISNCIEIKIPIIQRAYSQGGRGADESILLKGQRFINYLIDHLFGKPVELDFIYGIRKDDKLIILDGQQRLTTLFLLHWYLAIKEDKRDKSVIEEFLKFTYETRTTTRNFINQLSTEELDGYTNGDREISIVECIKNQGWFNPLWLNDPSVNSILGMLDMIDKRLQNCDKCWESLVASNSPITFLYTELEDFKLTDDLYIKMNARGKQLTSFEKFKATIVKQIDKNEWENKEHTETFSYKIDTVWTDLFWDYRDSHNRIDTYLIEFIAVTAINSLIKTNKTRASQLYNEPSLIEANDFSSKESYEELFKTFSAFSNIRESNGFQTIINTTFWFRQEKFNNLNLGDLFEIFISKKFEGSNPKLTWQQRALFYAVSTYLINTPLFEIKSFNNWCRVIRNIISNTTIDSIDQLLSFIGLCDSLIEGASDIYSFLRSFNKVPRFAVSQIKEEVLKANYMADEDVQELIFKMEDTNLCRGKIDFFLYCIDIDRHGKEFDRVKFKSLYDLAITHFEDENITNFFRRALLTIDDNEFFKYNKSFLYLISQPKYKIIESFADFRDNLLTNAYYKKYPKMLFDIMIKNQQTFQNVIENYNDTSKPNWLFKIIKDETLLNKYCKSNRITIANDNSSCYLLNVGRASKKEDCHKV